uniref:IGFBP N-terminal domain-containing protein n=1 Tax=Ciona savignyi TaxID=51511 RepID=H2Y754_CIOSA
MYILFAIVAVALIGDPAASAPASRFAMKCPVCSAEELNACPVLEAGPTCEIVAEPNCGCCSMCAKLESEECGVAKGYCGSGLTCAPLIYEYEGEVYFSEHVCMTDADLDRMFGEVITPPLEDPESHQNGEAQDTTLSPTTTTVIPTQEAHVPEGPCDQHWERVWSKTFFAKHEWVPECDREGYYSPQQCEVAYGLELGKCWCVDKLGNRQTDKMVDSPSFQC